jgi:hypothetical protein
MEVTVENPRWRPTGQIVQMVIENCLPDEINGTYDCLMINQQTFTIPTPATHGQVTTLGSASRFMNMIAGYFQTSILIYRNGSFEVRP